jgi:osmotically-inducible protein OsmY
MRRFFDGLAIFAIAVLGPAGLHADDRQIAQEIVKCLQTQEREGAIEDFDIDLQVKDGQVRLKGVVPSAEAQKLAIDTAQKVEGVAKVVNELKVSAPQSKATEKTTAFGQLKRSLMDSIGHDAAAKDQNIQLASHEAASRDNSRELAETIIAKLRKHMENGNLKGFGVEVTVDKGTATLSGRVSTAEQKKLALDAARSTTGIKNVVDKLVVAQSSRPATLQPPTPKSETPSTSNDLAKAVVSNLRKQKELGKLKDFSIDVNVVDGVVWLSGQVADEKQLQLVLDQARYVPGVKTVVNDLKLAGNASLAMTALQQPAPVTNPQVPGLLTPTAPPVAAGQPQMPRAFAQSRPVNYQAPGACATCPPGGMAGGPMPMGAAGAGMGAGMYDNPSLPGYAWPSYAPYPNYGAVTYPRQYSAQAWPYIGPFYPYPQVPLGWRKVTLEWDDGWWMLDFKSH